MYGYMRVSEDTPDNDVEQMELVLKDYADREGFCYATTFQEYTPGSQAAFAELVEELKRAEARHVIVPTLDHLSAHRILRGSMVERLEIEASACVWTLDGSGSSGRDGLRVQLGSEDSADAATSGGI
jgi:DNA invertase Pin-like site-specific DNA recombinase